jgi:uncharacterized phage protein gp47/JayE
VPALPTREDYFQFGAQEVFARGGLRKRRLSPQAVFTEGTDINIILAACCAMADEGTRHIAIRLAELWLDSAEGAALDRLVADRFSPSVVRKQASPAIVPLVFRRVAPPSLLGVCVFAVGSKMSTDNGTEFELLEPVAFGAGSTGPLTGVARAVSAGVGGKVDAGTIRQLLSFGEPSDSAVTVTNLEPASGGTDVESDESLRERARDFYRTARRGILAAIEFGALTVQGVESATAVELLGPDGLPNGIVQVYIADKHGRSNTVMAQAVKQALREFRGAGVPVDVLTSIPRFETIEFEGIGFRSNVDTRAAVNQLKALTVAVVNLLQPQEPLQRSLLFSLARSIPGMIVPQTSVAVPAGDVVPVGNDVIRTSLDLIKVNGL